MKANTMIFEIPESRLEPLVHELQQAVKADTGTEYSESTIRNSVLDWLGSRLDGLFEDAVERLTSPSYDDARQFARMLDSAESSVATFPAAAASEPESTVFSGYRAFSLEKMAAMVSYLSARTTDLYKTKLNKLLFYSDFANFYLTGTSISGSRYLHLPYGPVPEAYEETLETLNHYGVIDISRQNSAELVRSGENSTVEFLTSEEVQSLEWALATYGRMTATQLTEISHRERAYKNTRTGEEIAYEYAKFLYKLPDKTS
ncbi:MAG TPA: Panacea domain-containing protein [Pyrinomonadaceae bacterium]|nr:Panacea domain-containing protein [Pyrinomonadaceae bacterium]